MYNPKTWGAWVLLVAFIVGGIVTPVLHRIDHASRWKHHYGDFSSSQSEEHRGITVQEEFSWSYTDCSCPLCNQQFLSILPADLTGHRPGQIEALPATVNQPVHLATPAFHQIRAPPAVPG